MKVMNIGIIIRNDHDDTFPVALTQPMVGIIQNLLTQIPLAASKILDAQGKKAASQPSIPIIPRIIPFDWDMAYEPMTSVEEAKMMKALKEKYTEAELGDSIPVLAEQAAGNTTPAERQSSDGKILVVGDKNDDPEGKVKKLFTDPQNPYNMELNAKGRSNVNLVQQGTAETGTDTEETAGTNEGVKVPDNEKEDFKAFNKEYDEATDADETAGAEATMAENKAAGGCGSNSKDCTVTPPALPLSGKFETP